MCIQAEQTYNLIGSPDTYNSGGGTSDKYARRYIMYKYGIRIYNDANQKSSEDYEGHRDRKSGHGYRK